MGWMIAITSVAFVVLIVFLLSLKRIGPTQVGLMTKRYSFKKLSEDNPIAFRARQVIRPSC